MQVPLRVCRSPIAHRPAKPAENVGLPQDRNCLALANLGQPLLAFARYAERPSPFAKAPRVKLHDDMAWRWLYGSPKISGHECLLSQAAVAGSSYGADAAGAQPTA